MRKRTENQKKNNVRYQNRLYKKRRLMLKALKFIQWIYMHRPVNIQPAHLRHLHMRIAHILRLPYRWTDEDMRRAHNSLNRLMKEIYNAKVGDLTGGYQDLLVAMLDTLQIYNATTEDRAEVIKELMFSIAVELSAAYGEKKPPVGNAMLLALAAGKPPYPKWVVKEMAGYLMEHFRQSECIRICNELYELLTKALNDQKKVAGCDIAEDNSDEMVIGTGQGSVGHCIS